MRFIPLITDYHEIRGSVHASEYCQCCVTKVKPTAYHNQYVIAFSCRLWPPAGLDDSLLEEGHFAKVTGVVRGYH